MHVICDCTVALTETFEDVEVEGNQNVTVRNGYVRPNRLQIHADFSRWKALLLSHPPSGSSTGDVHLLLAYFCCFSLFLLFPVLSRSVSNSFLLLCIVSSITHLSISLPLWFQSLSLCPPPSFSHLLAQVRLSSCWPVSCTFPYPFLF